MAKRKGKVKQFNLKTGVGFIQPEDGSNDPFLFFPSGNNRPLLKLKTGDQIQYDIAMVVVENVKVTKAAK